MRLERPEVIIEGWPCDDDTVVSENLDCESVPG